MTIQKETADRIKAARKAAGLTQKQLAVKMDFDSPQAISMIERGNRNLSISILARVAKELDCTVKILLEPA